MDVDDAIKTRKSVRRYSDKKPDWRDIIRAIDSMRYAPMAGNLFSPRIIMVRDKEKIEQLKIGCQQDFVGQASFVIVVVSDDSKCVKAYGEEKGRKYVRQQAGAAIENLLLKLNSMKLATCWVGYFDDNAVKRALKIPDKLTVEAILPVGYETKIRQEPKPKPDMDKVLFFDNYDNKFMEPKYRVGMDAI